MILGRLKEETRALHETVEGLVGPFDRSLTRPNYVRLLQRFYGFYAPVEVNLGHVEGLASTGFNFEARRKSPLLERDLVALGSCGSEILSLPACEELPPFGRLGEALGCLYVLEGATLGGQIISRGVREALGLTPENGCAFFAGYGDETTARWRQFRECLSGYVEHGGDEETVIRSAKATFASLGRWIAREDARHGRRAG